MCVIDSVSYSLIVSLRSWKWISFYTLFETKRGRLDMSCSVGLALLYFWFCFGVCGIEDHENGNYGREEERFSEIKRRKWLWCTKYYGRQGKG